jgi:hypothetical protein
MVAVVQVGGRRLVQDRDAQLVQPGLQLAGVVGVDDQVGLVAGDGLDVRLVGRQVGLRRLGRVVRVAVDGHHLVAGADGEQHLGRGRRQRHDPLRLRRGRAGGGPVLAAGTGHQGQDQRQQGE